MIPLLGESLRSATGGEALEQYMALTRKDIVDFELHFSWGVVLVEQQVVGFDRRAFAYTVLE